MTFTREDLDNGAIDFSDVTDGDRLPPVTPGEVLRTEFLEPHGLSVYKLAQELHVPRTRLNDIVRGHRAITVDTALRFSHFFGTTAEFWMNLQTSFDLAQATRASATQIREEIIPLAG